MSRNDIESLLAEANPIRDYALIRALDCLKRCLGTAEMLLRDEELKTQTVNLGTVDCVTDGAFRIVVRRKLKELLSR